MLRKIAQWKQGQNNVSHRKLRFLVCVFRWSHHDWIYYVLRYILYLLLSLSRARAVTWLPPFFSRCRDSSRTTNVSVAVSYSPQSRDIFWDPKKWHKHFFRSFKREKDATATTQEWSTFLGDWVCSKGRSRRQTTQRNKRNLYLTTESEGKKGRKTFFDFPVPRPIPFSPKKRVHSKAIRGKKGRISIHSGKPG